MGIVQIKRDKMSKKDVSVKGLKGVHAKGAYCFGLTVGIVISFVFTCSSSIASSIILYDSRQPTDATGSPVQIDNSNKDRHDNLVKDIKDFKPFMMNDSHLHHDDDSVARMLQEKVRVLCWIMTSPQNLDIKAIHVKNTWAKRCNILVFFSSTTNDTFPTIGLNTSEGREHLTAKTMQGFKYVYDYYRDEADWFVKADDDTYIILENLRYFLSGYNTSDPNYFGHLFKPIVKQGYYSGGAGYVLSKEALRRLVTKGNNPEICRQDGRTEDANLGKCMEKLEVKTVNSTDALGRTRFHCFDPEYHLNGNYPKWYYSYDALGGQEGMESISDYAISFHYVSPQLMYALDFYIYHLRPYGIESHLQQI